MLPTYDKMLMIRTKCDLAKRWEGRKKVVTIYQVVQFCFASFMVRRVFYYETTYTNTKVTITTIKQRTTLKEKLEEKKS